MSAGQEFWIVASAPNPKESSDLTNEMRSVSASLFPAEGNSAVSALAGLKAGSFDTLVHLTDDLAKADASVDTIVHRLERQYAEVEANPKFSVKSATGEHNVLSYISKWTWDEAKCSASRPVADNLKSLMSTVTKIDEEVRSKLQQFNDAKTQRQNIAKKDQGALTTRDLVDVLTPSVVGKDDFVYTEHLTTVCVIIPKALSAAFIEKYESFAGNVVPGSAHHFSSLDDKDGNQLWRVVLLKSDLETFKKQCREFKVAPRDFEFSEDGYSKLLAQREELDGQVAEQLTKVKAICQLSWSDAMIAWMHIKAMRVFVECTLRYGKDCNVSAFVMTPKASARKTLNSIFKGDANSKALADAAAEDGEEYFPYVSLAFTPMTAQQK